MVEKELTLADVSSEKDLYAYLDQADLMTVRKMGDWMGFPSSENPFGLKEKIITAVVALVEVLNDHEINEDNRYLYDHVPSGVDDLLDWRDGCLFRLEQDASELYEALNNWQLSLF